MIDREEISKDIFSKIDVAGITECTPEFMIQSAILEVLFDVRDLLVEIKNGLKPRKKPLWGP